MNKILFCYGREKASTTTGDTFPSQLPSPVPYSTWKRGKSKCTRLRVNGALICDPPQLLQAWSQHFQSLAQSQEEKNPALKESIKQSSTLLSATFQKEEVFLDVAFCTEEVEHTQNKMKLKKSAGPDNLTAEHLKFGGQTITTWLTEILNSIVDVERIP